MVCARAGPALFPKSIYDRILVLGARASFARTGCLPSGSSMRCGCRPSSGARRWPPFTRAGDSACRFRWWRRQPPGVSSFALRSSRRRVCVPVHVRCLEPAGAKKSARAHLGISRRVRRTPGCRPGAEVHQCRIRSAPACASCIARQRASMPCFATATWRETSWRG